MINKYNKKKLALLTLIIITTVMIGVGINNNVTSANSNKHEAIKTVENISHNRDFSGGSELSANSIYKTIIAQNGIDSQTAKYAVKHAKVNWDKQAFNDANDIRNNKYLKNLPKTSKQDTYGLLTGMPSGDVTTGGFTKSQANYAIKYVK